MNDSVFVPVIKKANPKSILELIPSCFPSTETEISEKDPFKLNVFEKEDGTYYWSISIKVD